MKNLQILLLCLLLVSCFSSHKNVFKYDYSNMDDKTKDIHQTFEIILKSCIKDSYPMKISKYSRIDTIITDEKQKFIDIHLNRNFGYVPFREKDIMLFYKTVREVFQDDFEDYLVTVYSNDIPIQQLIPNYFRSSQDYFDQKRIPSESERLAPIVRNISKSWLQNSNLFNRNIALWHSHGWYYEHRLKRWEWQRARLFQTVEDIGPIAFTIPYLIPMLENAGANVFVPRERDFQTNEVIVDNDTYQNNEKWYLERESSNYAWSEGKEKGFAVGNPPYKSGDNPFKFGTYRTINSDSIGSASVNWIPEIPKDGEYCVYISYAQSDSNVSDAHYSVYHSGGKTEFLVNQTMGGHTWVYLGRFKFNQGQNFYLGRVELTNQSYEKGKIITADAVRFGGGMGVVERDGTTSGRPKFVEAARYYLQFAGMPDTLVYNLNNDSIDYNDDYQSRGEWVNYLKGSPFGPNKNRDVEGLNIPVDLSFAFHTDAGITTNDTVIGTLVIYSTQDAETSFVFPDGVSRLANRDFSDIMQTQIVNDLRAKWDPAWNRRGIWDRMYSEAWRPNVPATLLELFSHQNLLDVKFFHDPQYRFDVSRAIYKSMLRFIRIQNNQEYIVQPLPVTHFRIEQSAKNQVTLSWEAQFDPLEDTAMPDKFIVYTSLDGNEFDNGVIAEDNHITIDSLKDSTIYSFKVTAINAGGESFPSEVLSAGFNGKQDKPVLIINCFDRISGPATVESPEFAGFCNFIDAGVPDRYSLEYTGNQFNFSPHSNWTDDDSPGFGASYGDYETKVIPGNTFNYPYIHGKSILNAGYSFISCSDESIIDNKIELNQFKVIDLICGEEKSTDYPKPRSTKRFELFPQSFQSQITNFLNNNGNLFMSGSYIASDLYTQDVDSVNIKFALNTLKYKLRTDHAAKIGEVVFTDPAYNNKSEKILFNNAYDENIYAAEAPDGIEPSDSLGKTFLRYGENNISAGILYYGEYKIAAIGFPFETIISQTDRDRLMKIILSHLNRVKEIQ